MCGDVSGTPKLHYGHKCCNVSVAGNFENIWLICNGIPVVQNWTDAFLNRFEIAELRYFSTLHVGKVGAERTICGTKHITAFWMGRSLTQLPWPQCLQPF